MNEKSEKLKIALFAPVEGDKKDINTRHLGVSRYYEQEAIKCFKCWRHNGGWLSDIPIYAICPTRSIVSDETKRVFSDLNVTYIEHYFSETEDYDCGYWNIPLVGKWAEKNLEEEVLVKIDLDMYLIKPLPKKMFDYVIEDGLDIVGLHDSDAHEYLQKLNFPQYRKFFNTGLTITDPRFCFFQIQYDILKKLVSAFNKGEAFFKKEFGINVSRDYNERIGIENFEYHLLEELAVCFMDKERIHPIANYYLEAEENEISRNGAQFDMDSIYFIHEHLHLSDPFRNLKNKLQYAKVFGNHDGYKYFMSI